jgi:outer membrane protein assembly factor BamB
MRIPLNILCLLVPSLAGAADRGKVSHGLERLLYVTDRSGVSVYDINDSHKFLRKIDVPGTGDYKGIAASVQLGKLYLTSYQKDELVCVDLATDRVVWRRHYSDGYADSPAITPDGKALYLPLRDGDSWWVIDAATGDPKAKIPVTHGKEYAPDDHPSWV